MIRFKKSQCLVPKKTEQRGFRRADTSCESLLFQRRIYNAVSGKHYEDPELLEINTLENAIYMSMRNDLSFLIDARLSLYEHQSTYSPNLPPAVSAVFSGSFIGDDHR